MVALLRHQLSAPPVSSTPAFWSSSSSLNGRQPIIQWRAVRAVHSAPDEALAVEGEVAGAGSMSISSSSTTTWSVRSWRGKKARQQQPLYIPEEEEEEEPVVRVLEEYPPLVFAGEARALEERLAEAAVGRAFVLQGGDGAQSFAELAATNIRDTFRVILQMSAVLMFGGQLPVIKVGRLAGPHAKKPRLEEWESVTQLPGYRGDSNYINGDAFDADGAAMWVADPKERDKSMLRAYSQSAATLNLLRSFATGGYAAIQRNHHWNLDFTSATDQNSCRYQEIANRVDEALGFMSTIGLTVDHPIMTSTTKFWTSHECLLLPYEQAMTRLDLTTDLWYDCSTHMLWVEERTMQLDGAHIEFMRGIANPLGLKVSDKVDPKELVKVCQLLNPKNKVGRLTMIVRMGVEKVRAKLPHLIRAIREAGLIVTWMSDPMHGNTIKIPSGLKTRSFDAIQAEVKAFLDVHEQEGTYAGGIHLEMTGQNVTECIGGSNTITVEHLKSHFHTHCDPRLNASQSLELAFIIAEHLCKNRASIINFGH